MPSKSVHVRKELFHQSFIQSARFAPEIKPIPHRWRKRVLSQALQKMAWSSHYKIYESIALEHVRKFVDEHVPMGVDLSADDGDICTLAEKAAAHVATALWAAVSPEHVLQIIACECAEYGVQAPVFDELKDVIARAVDARWWRRQLRIVHGRAHEMGAINLGYVHYRAEPYSSNEAVLRRIHQNRRNALALDAVTLENDNGQQFKLSELAEKTTANKAIRRGELMLRINGFETLARERNHQGLFITWTCPSAYHARLKTTGKENPKYSGATPREANQYLGKVTAQARAALARRGIALYGFRIAEPHHDGCPHWHMLFFVTTTGRYKTPWITDIAARVIRIMKRYAWRADRGEEGAFKYRLDAKRIDWNKGSAAGYIAKYVSKNIDGAYVGEHKTIDGKIVAAEWSGEVELTPSARVEAWAATWGIRQFQQWGGAPVTVWRELRRIKKDMVNNAPPRMAQAWNAVQKEEGGKRADWAEYLRAQGGAVVARKDLVITLASDQRTVAGRYGEAMRVMPYGVRCSDLQGVVYHSTRYTWKQVERGGVAVAVDFALPRTRVNKCTQDQNTIDQTARPTSKSLAAVDLPEQAKRELLWQWSTLGACPYPRIQI
ncbi:replication endonuclease [Undibacterium sp. Jales W-56]|uniref:replication endonuclease n=1 Tax=Undibacterium sp. Jales W-56 TaxID=2897325 RepID=UPI0021D0BA4E|nr:replication endonuclease [Undibacterium sp. Jales W-56]MCU6435170.1 replication endonuclease [Undibacterium sp. Jales W-56]